MDIKTAEQKELIKGLKDVVKRYDKIVCINVEEEREGKGVIKEMIDIELGLKELIKMGEKYINNPVTYSRIQSDYKELIDEMVIKDADFRYRVERLRDKLKEEREEKEKLQKEIERLKEEVIKSKGYEVDWIN